MRLDMGYTHGTSSDSITRICTNCNKEFPNTHEYFNYANKKTGRLNAVCKACTKILNKKRNEKKRDENSDLNYTNLFYDGFKKCIACERDLPNNYLYYPPDKTCKQGLRNKCRECDTRNSGFLSEGFIPNQKWTKEETDLLIREYANFTGKELQEKFFSNRSVRSIESQAALLGCSGKNEETKKRRYKQQADIISTKLKGRIVSDETRHKLSLSKKEYYKTHDSYFKGRIVSEEEKEKARLRVVGRWAGNKNPRHINPLNGKDNGRWKGGILTLKQEFRSRINDWKNNSMLFCDYKCVISGGEFHNIHHTTPFNNILEECVNNTNFEMKSSIGEYTDEQVEIIEKELHRLHKIYGYGCCINKNIHKLFHDNYGYTNFTPSDFLEFIFDIQHGRYDDWFKSYNISININQKYLSYLIGLCDSLRRIA